MSRKVWLDKQSLPVITTTPNGESNAVRWGWTPATARPLPTREAVARTLDQAGAFCGTCSHEPGDFYNNCADCRRVLDRYADAILDQTTELDDSGWLARPLPTRDEIAMAIYEVLSSQYGSFNVPDDAADAVLDLLKGQES